MPKERVERDDEDLVRLYLTDIGQYPLLTKDDEVELAQKIEVGNEAQALLDQDKGTDPTNPDRLLACPSAVAAAPGQSRRTG